MKYTITLSKLTDSLWVQTLLEAFGIISMQNSTKCLTKVVFRHFKHYVLYLYYSCAIHLMGLMIKTNNTVCTWPGTGVLYLSVKNICGKVSFYEVTNKEPCYKCAFVC